VSWNFKARYGGEVQGKVSFFILQDEPMYTLGVPKRDKAQGPRIVAALNRHDRLVELLRAAPVWLRGGGERSELSRTLEGKVVDGAGAVRLAEEIEDILSEVDNAK
jgi:hypothetical protein